MKAGDNTYNPFELLHKTEELPPELKKEVMSTINLIHLAGNIGKLFTMDMIKTAGKMIEDSD
jgi:hypothetical protein